MRTPRSFLLSLVLAWGLSAPALAVVQQTKPGNAAYSITNTDTTVVTSVAFSAARTWTLPYAAGTCIGQTCAPPASSLQIIDVIGTVTASNTLTIAPQSGDTINGNAANIILTAAGARVVLIPTSGNNWQAYTVGNSKSATVLAASAVSLTTNTPANVTTISLSQGLWSCRGTISRTLDASTSVTTLSGSISATTATMGTQGVNGVTFLTTAANVMGATGTDTKVGPVLLAPTATTTYYLVANDVFTVSTDAAYGQLVCEQVR